MKKFIALVGIVVSAVSIAPKSLAQIYQYTELDSLYAVGLSQGQVAGVLTMANCAVSNTLTINQAAGTIEEAGTIFLPSSSATFDSTQMQTVAAVFPNPPQTVTGDVQLTLSYNGGPISFDTGTQSLTFQSGTIWGFNGTVGLSVPLNLSYSLVTGGETYTGSVEATLPATIDCGSRIDIANYPGSLQLLPDNRALVVNGMTSFNINVTAADVDVAPRLTTDRNRFSCAGANPVFAD